MDTTHTAAPSPLPGWDTLASPLGESLLTQAAELTAAGHTLAHAGAQLRRAGANADQVAATLTQISLRQQAVSKFGDIADKLLLTRAGLEQATRQRVATAHAERFRHSGCQVVADLGCGIGAESMALLIAGLGVYAIDIDPLTADFARHNLGVAAAHASATAVAEDSVSAVIEHPRAAPALAGPHGATPRRGSFSVQVGDAESAALTGVDGVFFDPARRTAGHSDTRRLTSADDYSPSLHFAFAVADQLPTGIKLGPGFDRELIPENAEAQWVSVDGQVVEMALWFGAVRRANVGRSALVFRGEHAHEISALHDTLDAEVRARGDYLYEPDGAVIRARLIGKLAEQLGAGMLSEGIAYLTADSLTETPFATAFRVVDELPVREKDLRKALAARGIGTLEIKKRGADVNPAALRTRLKLRGEHAATLFLTRAEGKHVALLAERVS